MISLEKIFKYQSPGIGLFKGEAGKLQYNNFMPKKVVITVLTVVLLSNFHPSANAIFGLSKCEKIKKAITKEELIGVALWKDFNRYRKLVVSKGFVKTSEYYDVTILLEPVLESDLKIFKITDENPQCFKSQELSYFRTQKSQAVRYLEALRSYFRSYLRLSGAERDTQEDKNAYNFLRTYYLSYGDIVTGKTLAR